MTNRPDQLSGKEFKDIFPGIYFVNNSVPSNSLRIVFNIFERRVEKNVQLLDHINFVDIPDDAIVYFDEDDRYYEVDKCMLRESNTTTWRNPELCAIACSVNKNAFACVPPSVKTSEFYNKVVTLNSNAISYVPSNVLTKEVILTAVKKCGLSLKYIPEDKQDEEICNAAIEQDYNAVKFAKFVSNEVIKVLIADKTLVNLFTPEQLMKYYENEVSELAKKVTELSQSAEPAQPTEPTQPAEPAQPAEPVQPAQPAEPAEPVQPAEPAQPTEPTEPAQPTEPVQADPVVIIIEPTQNGPIAVEKQDENIAFSAVWDDEQNQTSFKSRCIIGDKHYETKVDSFPSSIITMKTLYALFYARGSAFNPHNNGVPVLQTSNGDRYYYTLTAEKGEFYTVVCRLDLELLRAHGLPSIKEIHTFTFSMLL